MVSGKAGAESARFRRKLPCINHHKTPAVRRCEICGRPVCKECLLFHENMYFCSEGCRDLKKPDAPKGDDRPKPDSAAKRLLRKQRNKQADRLIVGGLWAFFLIIAGLVATLVYTSVVDHSGQKIWECSRTADFFQCQAEPNFFSFFVLSGERKLWSDPDLPPKPSKVEALDLLSGGLKWSIEIEGDIVFPQISVIDEERCLLYSERNICLLDSTSAEKLWDFTLPEDQRFLFTKPVALEECIYASSIHVGPPEPSEGESTQLSDSGSLPATPHAEYERRSSVFYALDASSGKKLWQNELENFLVQGVLAGSGRVYLAGYQFHPPTREPDAGPDKGSDAGPEKDSEDDMREGGRVTTELWAFTADTGKAVWKLELDGAFLVPPVGCAQGLIFATMENIYLLSKDGRVQWKYPLQGAYVDSLQPRGDKLFVATYEGVFKCISMSSGKPMWATEIGVSPSKIIVQPPLVFVAGLTKEVKAQRKLRPTKRWQGSYDLLEQASKREIVYNRTLYGIDIATGEKAWSIPKVTGEFAYSAGFLYVMRTFEALQVYNATADPSELSRSATHFSAYDCMTGERAWDINIGGDAYDLHLTDFIAVVMTREFASPVSPQVVEESGPLRFVAISLR